MRDAVFGNMMPILTRVLRAYLEDPSRFSPAYRRYLKHLLRRRLRLAVQELELIRARMPEVLRSLGSYTAEVVGSIPTGPIGVFEPPRSFPRRFPSEPRTEGPSVGIGSNGGTPGVRAGSNGEAMIAGKYQNAPPIDWGHIERYLFMNYAPKVAAEYLALAKSYHYVLFSGDASALLSLRPHRRIKAMRALSALARVIGLKNEWRSIREAYGLKWTVDEGLPPILSSRSYSELLLTARKIIEVLEGRSGVVEFIALSGLRVSEALEAIRLYKSDGDRYLNRDLLVLEHFRYPRLFIRRTKRAYITVLDDYMLDLLEGLEPLTYDSLRMLLRRRLGSPCDLKGLRKLWATYMRLRGIESEVIDLLQGRTPRSVFLRYYFRPDLRPLLDAVRSGLEGLRRELGIGAR